MQQLRQQLSADKKQLVAANLELTDRGGRGLLAAVRAVPEGAPGTQRPDRDPGHGLCARVQGQHADRRRRRAADEGERWPWTKPRCARQGVAARLAPVLPGRKLARYLQIENKVRALVRYEIAAEVPLAR